MRLTLLSFFVSAIFAFSFTGAAQETNSPDSLFQLARKAAFDEKNYDKAKTYLYKGLTISPSYNDLRTFLGRLHAWDKNYDSARFHFDIVLSKDPTNTDALLAYTDVEYWSDQYAHALELAERGIATGKNRSDFLIRKARILIAQPRDSKKNLETLNQLTELKSTETDVRLLIERLNDIAAVNTVGVSYEYLHFQNQFPDPWHLVSFSYGRKTKIGSVTGRVNYANRFGNSGYQYEVDAYPRFSKTFYSYMSVGYSNDVGIFPAWRAGFSLYANLPAAYEAELGVRYLYFSDPTFVYTVYAGKYISNFLLGARAYITPSNNTVSQSYNVSARYYFGAVSDYIGVTLGSGISPDERSQLNQFNTIANLRSYRAALNVQKTVARRNVFSFNLGYTNQEYQPAKKDNQLQAGVGYQLRF
jgi:YaiO family outer membrane protein